MPVLRIRQPCRVRQFPPGQFVASSVSSKAPIRVESLKHENLTGKLWKEVDDGCGRDGTLILPGVMRHSGSSRPVTGVRNFSSVSSIHRRRPRSHHLGNTCTEHGPRDAIVPDIWWGTTREFRVRMKVTEPGDNEREQKETVSAFSAPMTFTFPPMPVELVLAKMGAPVHATTCTSIVRRMIQAACVRQLYRWRGGLCIKEDRSGGDCCGHHATPAGAPRPRSSARWMSRVTPPRARMSNINGPSLCVRRSVVSGHPPREGYKSMCVKDTALADIVEAFAEGSAVGPAWLVEYVIILTRSAPKPDGRITQR